MDDVCVCMSMIYITVTRLNVLQTIATKHTQQSQSLTTGKNGDDKQQRMAMVVVCLCAHSKHMTQIVILTKHIIIALRQTPTMS